MRFTPRECARHMDAAADRLEHNLIACEGVTLDEALREAREMSGGPFTLAMLAAMGHPYARRAPNPPADPAIINVQTGRFRDSWYEVPPELQGAVIVSRLPNDAPEARFLRGTTKMIERPITERLDMRLQDGRYARVLTTIRKTVRGEI